MAFVKRIEIDEMGAIRAIEFYENANTADVIELLERFIPVPALSQQDYEGLRPPMIGTKFIPDEI